MFYVFIKCRPSKCSQSNMQSLILRCVEVNQLLDRAINPTVKKLTSMRLYGLFRGSIVYYALRAVCTTVLCEDIVSHVFLLI